MEKVQLPFTNFTSRILEQAGYFDISSVVNSSEKDLRTRIKKAGFDASKARVCISEISEYERNKNAEARRQENMEKKKAADRKKASLYNNTCALYDRKEAVNSLFEDGKDIAILTEERMDTLLKDIANPNSKSKSGILINTFRMIIQAMGYYLSA